MKSNRTPAPDVQKHHQRTRPHEPSTAEEREQQKQSDKSFMIAMNVFTAKAGLLSDDPYFGGI
jgi:antitoxin CcdA